MATNKNDVKIGDVIKVGTNKMELIEFKIKKKTSLGKSFDCIYGINVFKVREVIPLPEIIPLPEDVPYIVGMFSLRNENIPLLNLVERLNGNQEEKKFFVIVAEFNNIYIGLLVHEVVQIHRISWEDILPPPKVSSSDEAGLIIGVVQISERGKLVILDFEKIVNEIDMSQQEEVDRYRADRATKKQHKNIRVLIADDSKTVRTQMKTILLQSGFEVTEASNGKEAFDILHKYLKQSNDQNVPLRKVIGFVITDIEMPLMDGYTLTKSIKEHTELSQIPVIMHTSLSGDNVKLKGAEVGCDGYITKFNLTHFTKAINEVLSKFPLT
jgi:two-component system, chemotaxis family, chemotaxis protein CheV